jgi:hypothetical protein
VIGPVERGRRAVDAAVVITLDPAGDPVHVEITTVASGPELSLVLDVGGLGDPVPIAVPAVPVEPATGTAGRPRT